MKTWKHGIFGILAVITLTLAFTACDDGNGKDNGKKDPCPCTNKVHYDTPCDCVGVGNDCDCTVVYKPALTDVFTYRTTATQEVQDKVGMVYNAIWASNPQLLLRLKNTVAIKGSQIEIGPTIDNVPLDIAFLWERGRISVVGRIEESSFATAFETAIGDACDYYESQ